MKGGGRIFLILEEFGVVLSKCHMDVDMGQQIDRRIAYLGPC